MDRTTYGALAIASQILHDTATQHDDASLVLKELTQACEWLRQEGLSMRVRDKLGTVLGSLMDRDVAQDAVKVSVEGDHVILRTPCAPRAWQKVIVRPRSRDGGADGGATAPAGDRGGAPCRT
jgi:hypothetical protein